jgi:hypothetical protein
MSLLVLIAALMKADGKVLKSELDYVKRFFIQQFGEASAKEALIMLRDILNRTFLSGMYVSRYPGIWIIPRGSSSFIFFLT